MIDAQYPISIIISNHKGGQRLISAIPLLVTKPIGVGAKLTHIYKLVLSQLRKVTISR